MASLKEYQEHKTHQEAFRKMVGTLGSPEEDWKPCISPQVALKMEVSSPCIPCSLIRTRQARNYPKQTYISTTTSISGGARGMENVPGYGLKTQERQIVVSSIRVGIEERPNTNKDNKLAIFTQIIKGSVEFNHQIILIPSNLAAISLEEMPGIILSLE
ncbi:hypothetical protein O181_012849 [Austropuccinia psidii MF-1]|uniref:Uncharacterized protein n=1 Tax=Austropuccinia psidii MF-1 TaxID=1389203 RepID=A0A9Q3BX26_9BASI|nr:hypothetical protein [Austropuccinia psidii MF-1]